MTHPFMRISPAWLPKIFWPMLFVTLVLMAIMNYAGNPLNNPSAPAGIVSFELAGSPDRAGQILESWDAKARLAAAFGLGLDYLFMVFYSSTLSLGCIWTWQILKERALPIAGVGILLGWSSWLAALFDGTENLALLILLFASNISPWPEIARICAILKFSLIFLAIVYAIYGLVASRFTQRTWQAS
jgi:hypothetical protein